MNENTTILLREYNPSSSRVEQTGPAISTYQVARSLTLENFTSLFDEFLNLGGKGWREGKQVGLQLRYTHRSLQRLAICFCLGVLCGLAEQEFTDPRNETAVETARKIAGMLAEGELPFGPYI